MPRMGTTLVQRISHNYYKTCDINCTPSRPVHIMARARGEDTRSGRPSGSRSLCFLLEGVLFSLTFDLVSICFFEPAERQPHSC